MLLISNTTRAFCLSCAMAAITALPAIAQVNLTARTSQSFTYDTAVSWQERAYRPAGIVEYVHVPGSLLLDLRMVFEPPWSDDFDRVSINTREIHLILPDGSELRPIGSHSNWGQMLLRPSSVSARRPRDFPDDPGAIHWNGVFVVPKGISTATLRFSDDDTQFQGNVTIPAPSQPQDAASFADFSVSEVARFRRAELQDGRDETAISSYIQAPAGMVLAEIEVEIEATGSNQSDGDDRFTWHTHNFRLVDAAGQTMGLVGERFQRRLLDSQFSGTDVGDDSERTMLWVVPEGLSEARLLFGETEVAQVALGAATITDTD
ncbi:hypothetical protein [Pararhodobacter oceanensis]|uniref:hypothetical protein n=1 Tax=Pararhodobacter oceanensis TaxID=2172121 RepID=UPI003A8CD874